MVKQGKIQVFIAQGIQEPVLDSFVETVVYEFKPAVWCVQCRELLEKRVMFLHPGEHGLGVVAVSGEEQSPVESVVCRFCGHRLAEVFTDLRILVRSIGRLDSGRVYVAVNFLVTVCTQCIVVQAVALFIFLDKIEGEPEVVVEAVAWHR